MATDSPTKKLMKPVKNTAPKEPVETVTTTEVKQVVKKLAPKVAEVETVVEEDLIVKTSHELENLKAEKAFSLVPTLLENVSQDYFKLGGVLSVIHSNGWFMDHGHETFAAFVEAECNLHYRKAKYLMDIYTNLVNSGVPWNKVKHLGWTKLKDLASEIDAGNVDAWVSIAENSTVLTLQERIKAEKSGISAADSPEVKPAVSNPVSTMTFKLYSDQRQNIRDALDKAKNESSTESDAVALEAMALDFLGGESKLKKIPTLLELMTGKSPEEVLEVFGQVFPDVAMTVEIPE